MPEFYCTFRSLLLIHFISLGLYFCYSDFAVFFFLLFYFLLPTIFLLSFSTVLYRFSFVLVSVFSLIYKAFPSSHVILYYTFNVLSAMTFALRKRYSRIEIGRGCRRCQRNVQTLGDVDTMCRMATQDTRLGHVKVSRGTELLQIHRLQRSRGKVFLCSAMYKHKRINLVGSSPICHLSFATSKTIIIKFLIKISECKILALCVRCSG